MPEALDVLIVDDEPQGIKRLRKRLEKKLNKSVKVCRTLNDACRVIRTTAPQFVVLDLYLPTEYDEVPECPHVTLAKFNEGRRLECLLKDKEIPYLFYTNNANVYNGNHHDKVYEKDQINEVFSLIEHVLCNDSTADQHGT